MDRAFFFFKQLLEQGNPFGHVLGIAQLDITNHGGERIAPRRGCIVMAFVDLYIPQKISLSTAQKPIARDFWELVVDELKVGFSALPIGHGLLVYTNQTSEAFLVTTSEIVHEGFN